MVLIAVAAAQSCRYRILSTRYRSARSIGCSRGQRRVAPRAHIGQQLLEVASAPERFEQRIAFEEREAWEPGIGRDLQPSMGCNSFAELRVGGAEAVRHMVIAVRARHDPPDAQASCVELAAIGDDAGEGCPGSRR